MARTDRDILASLAPLICATALLFNAVLAAINANVTPLSRGQVIAVEVALTASALILALRSWRPSMLPWFALIFGFVLLFFVGIVINQEINVKYVRDAIIFPVYVLLGMVWAGRPILPLIVGVQCVAFAVLLLEMMLPSTYASIFSINRYYINTRDFDPELFQYTQEGFFISAFRPDDRFIPGFDWLHRTSTIFLEPVSLGNYVTLMTILIAVFWAAMSWRLRIFMVVSNALLLIGSDGRLASMTCVIIILATPFFARAPRYIHVFYLPFVVIAAALAIAMLGLQPVGDDFAGRLAIGVDLLLRLDLVELFGFTQNAGRYADAGLAYFVVSQTVVGATVILLMIGVAFNEQSGRERIFIHGITTYFALSLLISFSVFSIKTAALMWFVYGYLMETRRTSTQSEEKLYVGTHLTGLTKQNRIRSI